MKRFTLGFLLLVVMGVGVLLFSAGTACASAGCGFRPFPPYGCLDGQAHCICDSDGRCEWVWVCR